MAGADLRPDTLDRMVEGPNLDVSDSSDAADFRVLGLESLVRVELTAFQTKDQVHLLDMIELGMIDVSWCDRFTAPLTDRLRKLLADPR